MHSEHSTEARIDEEAAEWLIDLKDPESWHEDRTRPESFLDWLTQSKRHGDAFYEVACTWRKLDVFSRGQLAMTQAQGHRANLAK